MNAAILLSALAFSAGDCAALVTPVIPVTSVAITAVCAIGFMAGFIAMTAAIRARP